MMDATHALEARQLSKRFGQRLVLDRTDLTIAAGEAVALMGSNGAGKTTLLRCLASALRPSSGEVFWFGHRAGCSPSSRRNVGMVGHETYLYPNLTVQENLLFAARMCDVSNPVQRVSELIASMGLRSHSDRLTSELSRGMRQRVAIGRAVVHQPRIILMDEPFSGLDEEGSDWLRRLFESRGGGWAICFTSHDEEKARELSDRVVILRCGALQVVHEIRARISA
jgi:heme ABC exporter ATP-binding subunit CcmA